MRTISFIRWMSVCALSMGCASAGPGAEGEQQGEGHDAFVASTGSDGGGTGTKPKTNPNNIVPGVHVIGDVGAAGLTCSSITASGGFWQATSPYWSAPADVQASACEMIWMSKPGVSPDRATLLAAYPGVEFTVDNLCTGTVCSPASGTGTTPEADANAGMQQGGGLSCNTCVALGYESGGVAYLTIPSGLVSSSPRSIRITQIPPDAVTLADRRTFMVTVPARAKTVVVPMSGDAFHGTLYYDPAFYPPSTVY